MSGTEVKKIPLHEHVAAGDKVVSHWMLQGTNTAPCMG